jgi:3-oxoacyl-[acyl-carrier-protein] synthase II
MSHRVVVTGIGVIHALGESADEFFASLLAGKSGIKRITSFDPTGYTCQVASEHTAFNPEAHMDPKDARRSDRFIQFAMAASKKAVVDAGMDMKAVNPDRTGVIIGSGVGGMHTIEEQVVVHHEKGPRRVSPFTIPMLISNMAAGMVAIELGAKGPNYSVVSACASGSHAIGDAFKYIRSGECDVMVAGGAEAAITPVAVASFCSLKALSTEYNETPERASRPFDAKRDGFVMGEGAGILILESLEHAQARGAKIYAEMVGYGASCDAFHITQPHPDGVGLILCLNKTLADAGITPDQVGYINAHGTSTHFNDMLETKAIREVFGEHARSLKISSTKSMTGHLLGAAGGVEAAVAVMALKTGKIPPTINYENPDPDCDLDYVPNHAIDFQVEYALSDNLGFGGHNACLAFKRWAE